MQTGSALKLLAMSRTVFLASFILASGSGSQDPSQCNEGQCATDAASLMQGIVHVDFSGSSDASHPRAKPLAARPTEAQTEAALASIPPEADRPAGIHPNKYEIISSARRLVEHSNASTMTGLSLIMTTLQTKTFGFGSVMLIVLLGLCLASAAVVLFAPQFAATGKRSASGPPLQSGSGMASQNGASASGFPRSTALSPSVLNLPPQTAGRFSSAAFTDYPLGHSPAGTALLPHMSPQVQGQAPFAKQVPPPLCPTLVMPVCEARFGVPMTDIAKLGQEGEINIVGLSGNPLLRSMIRVTPDQHRTLEICMPEKNSAPRATVSPSQLGCATNGYDIRGMKGSFYGFLEIQPCGTCAVIKDGHTVLLLDGDTDNLQLSIKSGQGSQLASVRCSAEPFGGVDHVEIRVEPGVDTVLVLAVVLGVLVLAER